MNASRALVLLLYIAMLEVGAAPCAAGGLSLRWDACFNGGGVQDRSFACDVNTGTNVLAASFEPDADIVTVPPHANAVVDLASAGSTLPAWWSSTCRPASIVLVPTPSSLSTGCNPVFASVTGAVLSFVPGLYGSNTLRMVVAISTGHSALQVFSPGLEYVMFQLVVDARNTVGSGSCAGCTTPACLVFNSLDMDWGSPTVHLSGAAFAPGSDYVTWQGGAGVQAGGAIGCPAATPVRRAMWGSVKALYR